MRVYNAEIFDQSFMYKCSSQTEDEFEYSYDYLDPEKNTLIVHSDNVKKGDYIRITGEGFKAFGIIADVTETDKTIIDYKPMHRLFDIDVYTSNTTGIIENILSDLIVAEYVNNPDTLQNIEGLEVVVNTSTRGAFAVEPEINNLLEMVVEAFTSYGIIIDFDFDPQMKKILCTIGKNTLDSFIIESDLDNIFEKNIVFKESGADANKAIIYSDDFSQSVIYYLDANGNITQNPTSRVIPVNCKQVTIHTKEGEFEEKAQAKALDTLTLEKFNNLMEITVYENDCLVKPFERKIGQNCFIKSNDKLLPSVITGYRFENGRITLVCGCIRLELTKQLKKRWRKSGK